MDPFAWQSDKALLFYFTADSEIRLGSGAGKSQVFDISSGVLPLEGVSNDYSGWKGLCEPRTTLRGQASFSHLPPPSRPDNRLLAAALPEGRLLLLGVGASPSRPDSQGSCKPQTGTKRGLDSLWSCCPLETQPVEYWGLRILRLSLCFLSGDSGQWGVCVRGVEGARFLPDGSSMSGAGGLKGKGTA